MKKKTAIAGLYLSAAFITIPFAAKHLGLRVNTTDSAPVGIWITKPHQGIHRGALVSICPPERPVVRAMVKTRPLYAGDCESGSIDLLKPIAAIPGDTVIFGIGNVIINGFESPNTSAHFPALAYTKGEYLVGEGEVWVFSTYTSDSFDSRYFGPVPISNIRGIAEPVLIDGQIKNMTKRVNHD